MLFCTSEASAAIAAPTAPVTAGGISRSIARAKGGDAPPVYIVDATQGEAKVRSLAEQVELETRTRTLNPKWYEGMLEHGYEGVRQIEVRAFEKLQRAMMRLAGDRRRCFLAGRDHLILPAFGVFSEVFSTFSTKRLYGYHSLVWATLVRPAKLVAAASARPTPNVSVI